MKVNPGLFLLLVLSLLVISLSAMISGKTNIGNAVYTASESEFSHGYTKDMAIKDKIKFNLSTNSSHILELVNITSSSATIKITSDPQIATLFTGDSRKFEINGDSHYDLSVLLNKIYSIGNDTLANITIQSVYELIIPGEETQDNEESKGLLTGKAVDVNIEKQDRSPGVLRILTIAVIAIIVGILGFIIQRLKNKN